MFNTKASLFWFNYLGADLDISILNRCSTKPGARDWRSPRAIHSGTVEQKVEANPRARGHIPLAQLSLSKRACL